MISATNQFLVQNYSQKAADIDSKQTNPDVQKLAIVLQNAGVDPVRAQAIAELFYQPTVAQQPDNLAHIMAQQQLDSAVIERALEMQFADTISQQQAQLLELSNQPWSMEEAKRDFDAAMQFEQEQAKVKHTNLHQKD
ncbi:hypothetical protein CS022_19785 [Veronia nyctiphanis]|uniref:Uncharacterized protein n=1 Tax=Veronia nyctiphanis TaxID=1278244 RepID=A0A4V1LSI4_9GAMM|nr:hypothetical protein [Veronia nyctiphanis]RXJ71808.1 hypothetical protein CS022_19785 [Veronia nyctiphanis]